MNRKHFNRLAAIVLSATMVLGQAAFAFAADDTVYVSLGKDLSTSQTKTVLNLLGIDDLNDCTVSYVTNAEEHEYLDSYVSSSEIGTYALSSVKLVQNDSDEINVEIYNINYCTEDMYKNALETAGVTGADVVVAGPYPISGTAALVGTIKLYEESSGTKVSDEVIEGAVDELTTTGEVGEEIGDKDTAADIIADVKEQLADNPNMSEDEIIQAIKDAAEKAGVTLSDSTIEQIKNMVTNLQGLNIDWDSLASQGAGILNRIINWIKSLIG